MVTDQANQTSEPESTSGTAVGESANDTLPRASSTVMSDSAVSNSSRSDVAVPASKVSTTSPPISPSTTPPLVSPKIARQIANLRAQHLVAAETLSLQRTQYLGRQYNGLYGGHRDFDSALGYKKDLTFSDLQHQYTRGGIACNLIDIFVEDTWADLPNIYDVGDPANLSKFETDCLSIFKLFNIWQELERADKQCGIAGYSVVYLATSSNVSAELSTSDKIEHIIAYPQSYVSAIDLTPLGLPAKYHMRFSNTGAISAVDASKVVHIVEDTSIDRVLGSSKLEKPFNLLSDLMKVVGSGAEASWINSIMRLFLKMDANTKFVSGGEAELEDEIVEMFHGLRAFAKTKGIEPEAIKVPTQDFSPNAQLILKMIASTGKIVWNRFIGNEIGLRSSETEQTTHNDRIARRRSRVVTPWITRIVDALVLTGQISKPVNNEYNIVWPRRETLTETDKAATAETLARANKLQFESTGQILFPTDEIRRDIYDKTTEDINVVEPDNVKSRRRQRYTQPTNAYDPLAINSEIVDAYEAYLLLILMSDDIRND